MTFQPVLPWAIFAVVVGALVLGRLVALRQLLWTNDTARRGRVVLRWGGVTLAVLLLLAATTRPALRHNEIRRGTAAAGANLNVFLVVDRSADSGVADYGGTREQRIAGMRADIEAVLKRYPAARYALVAVGSRAVLEWPLSEDVWSLRPTVAALSTYQNEPDAGSDVNNGAAGDVLRYQLAQAVQHYPGSRNAVLYFGSGAPGSRAPQHIFDVTQGRVDGGAVLGYGRSEAIDEPELRQAATDLGVPYLHRDPGQPFQPDLPDSPDGTRIEAAAAQRIELYWLPALLAAGLLLIEIYFSVREFRRGRIARRDLAR
ncbi:vWA domain-containing protein [Mycobacterium bourgelatii]|uniref:VWFA domain-containing protein n=1 Tax=Mycobacterium bourgelatii TaxID=1273442 RepID=A0A7I9YV41_MYCBU|nr:VWA domain-containing protein [Mycobacterium bourgelatii]MCV6977225.1 VWA domain-containing protein [Mycobacterium bourgelatii]GFG92488.1 hypothetical protein MBOU_45300 [Mycobacterium bourgelatii]